MTRMNETLIARALASRAPRYTSYPPATQFTDRVGPDTMLRWLAAVPSDACISVYVHIPFCRRLCWFCACRTQGIRKDSPLAPYLDALEREIETLTDAMPSGVRLGRLHLGGGTPTLLSPTQIDRLFGMIEARIPRSPGAEISVEVDPTEIDDARLDALTRAGVTRASLGVQDFEPRVQAAIGRPQTPEQTQETVNGLRDRGVAGINLDLLYGLPHQMMDSLDRTIDRVLTIRPDRIALYGYAHVPWVSKRQVMIRDADLPDARARLNLSNAAATRFTRAGYRPIGIDHFALPHDTMAIAAGDGSLRRNFQGYTCDRSDVLLGLGASAISRFPQGYAQNASQTNAWSARVLDGRPATARGHGFDCFDALEGAVIERLLCDFEIAPEAFTMPEQVRNLTALIAAAWPDAVRYHPDGRLQVRPGHEPLVRMMALEIDAYADRKGRHSMAI